MSYSLVINHIQSVLNACGDSIQIIPLGQPVPHESGHMSIEIQKTYILRQNRCCAIPPPSPMCTDNPIDKYCINRIRISNSMADDYSKSSRWTDAQIRDLICSKTFLFGCYD